MSQMTEVMAALNKQAVECQVGSQVMRIETGEVAKQAGGSVLVTCGGTVVLVTACASPAPREGVDFFPLTVDYEERMYAAGKIPGGWVKRESRPPERCILVSRLIDRPCRPLFPEGFRNDVHIVGLCVSADEQNNPDVLALTGAGAALSLSDIPFDGPVAGVRVGYVDGEFLINPTEDELKDSQLNLVVAGTYDNLNMVECGCNVLPEDVLIQAFEVAHEAIRKIISAIRELTEKCGKPKGEYPVYEPSAELETLIRKYQFADLAKAMRIMEKQERERAFDAISLDALKALVEADAALSAEDKENALALCGSADAGKDFAAISKHIKEEELMTMIVDEGKRPDGRRVNEIRPLWGRVGVLPRTHGSAIFTRGQTQALSVATLGTLSEIQTFDNVFGVTEKRYIHHYNFPPFSVGEARAMRSPGRREIGHGALAERALLPVIPSAEEFPYAIRVVSDILESNGSSSMASTCGSTLALLDAGVPIKAPVAGIAMGLIKKGDNYTVLTDIQGMEDAFGEMDFKVTGTAEGVTALQMDIKLKGVTMDVLRKALAQAREARLEILDMIHEVIPEPRKELSEFAPKVITMQIPPERIKDVIGPGGKMINKIIAETGAKVDIENDGKVFIAAVRRAAADAAVKMVDDLTRDVEAGEEYEGKVQRIMDFGAFVEILPGREGLLHISKMKPFHVRKVEDVLNIGDSVKVRVEEIDNLGRINLTRQGLWSEEEMAEAEEGNGEEMSGERPPRERRERRDRGERMPRRPERSRERAPRSGGIDLGAGQGLERADSAPRGVREERIAPRYQEDMFEERPMPRRREPMFDERPMPRRRESMYEERPMPRRVDDFYDERPMPRRREMIREDRLPREDRPMTREPRLSREERAPRYHDDMQAPRYHEEMPAPRYHEDFAGDNGDQMNARHRRRRRRPEE